ncbi:type I iterative PKS [Penicillium ochrochloron]
MAPGAVASSNLLLFTDQSQDPAIFFKSILQEAHHAKLLSPFLQASISALKNEAKLLLPTEQKLLASLDSIPGLIAQAHAENKNVITSTILLCMAQLCSLQIFCKHNPDLLANNGDSTHLLGLCTGFLPAVVAASSASWADLVELGTQTVSVALRLAVEVHRRSQAIEKSASSWSTAIRGVSQTDMETIINSFHESKKIPPYRYTYISATSPNGFTISGPPSTLKQLLADSPRLVEAQKAALPIYGAFHAEHLNLPDLYHIAAPASAGNRELRPNMFILSPSSERVYLSRSVKSILIQGLEDILRAPISQQTVIKHAATRLDNSPANLLIVGPKWGTTSICQGLRAEGATLLEDQFSTESPLECRAAGQDDIAIIGMSGRFPGGPSLEDFWSTLTEGKQLHTQIPKSRFDASRYFDTYGDQDGKNPSPHACFIEEVGFFDTHLFSMSPREARQTDPTQRLLMMATYEALEMAGYSRDYDGKVGTFFGQTTDDWRESNAGQNPDVYYVPGTIRAFGPGRLNYFFKWDGPSYSIDTACSSSLAAVEIACNALRLGDCDMAIAGGGNVLTGPNMFRGLSRGGFLSPTGACKTFDDEADGYCRGEAVGVVILKPLHKAITDKDTIYGTLRGIATNHSADAISITHPHQSAQEQLFSTVLNKSGLSPASIDYVELHGTGTQAGDSIEVASVANTFGGHLETEQPLYIGAVKANVGHSESAAGITSLIKALLMFQKSRIPPHAGIRSKLNHKIEYIEELNIRIPRSGMPFASRSGQERRRIMVNNFNATVRSIYGMTRLKICASANELQGGNTSLVLEEYPQNSIVTDPSPSYYPVLLSAKSLKALNDNRVRLLRYLKENRARISLADLSYTTTCRRLHHPFRASYSTASIDSLIEQITEPKTSLTTNNRDIPNTVFTFAGQGATHRGIAKRLFGSNTAFRNSVMAYNKIAIGLGFPSFLEYLTEESDGSPSLPVVEQLSLVSFEIAMAELWISWGITPTMVVGHSLGEYSALCVGGALSVADTIYLVGTRAELMQAHCSKNTHAMLVTSLSLASARNHCDSFGSCEISCINGPISTVISGTRADLEKLQDELVKQGTRVKALEVPYAFHSAQMDPILVPLAEAAQSVSFSKLTVPVSSSLIGEIMEAGSLLEPDYLVRHVRQPVNFTGAVSGIEHNHKTTWLECGPGVGCQSMIKLSINTSPMLMSSLKKDSDSWKVFSENLASFYEVGQEIRWSAFYEGSDLQLLNLPPYAFDTQNFYIDIKEANAQDPPSKPVSRELLSTCVQFLEEKVINPHGDAMMRFFSNSKQEQLLAAIEGHKVGGYNLCPSSVYVEMAVTSAGLLYREMKNVKAGSAIEVTDIEIFRPLVASFDGPDMKISVQSRMSPGFDAALVSIGSEQPNESPIDHATCNVHFGDGESWQRDWSRYSDMILERMNQMARSDREQDICRIPGKLVYQIFAWIVDYDEKYHSISDILIDCDRNEACGTIRLPAASEYGQFTCSPYSIDGLVHFAGFLLNHGLGKSKDTAYISSGWESIRILQGRLTAKSYGIYSRLKESKKKGLWVGDVYLLDGEEIVATCFGLKFQQIKLSLLHRLLKGSLGAEKQENEPPTSHTPKISCSPNLTPTPPLDLFVRVANIVAEEVGMELSTIPEEARFAGLGIDSLLSVSITSSVQHKTGLLIPTGLFDGDSTLSKVRAHLQLQCSSSSGDTAPALDGSSPSPSSASPLTPSSTSPSSSSSSIGDSSAGESEFEVFLSAVVEETGCELSDLQPETQFADLGIDSLLCISILAAFQDVTGKGLPSSLFSDHPTVDSIHQMFKESAPKPTPCIERAPTELQAWPEYSNFGRLLQGNPNSKLPPLFLVAPGSGYPGSYINLPELYSGLPVYTLESPFLQFVPPGGWTMERAASVYIKEIRRIQPHGPYIFGGWSIGGMYSYEISRQLLAEGETVLGVLLIDSPCPNGMPNMPTPTIEAVELTGLYAPIKREGLPDIDMPQSLKEHTIGSLKALKKYIPEPMKPNLRPRMVMQIWASKGEYDKLPLKVAEATELLEARRNGRISDERQMVVSKDWQTTPRSSFGSCGWDRLVGELVIHVVDGDHESIMSPPQISLTGNHLQDAIKKILEMEK